MFNMDTNQRMTSSSPIEQTSSSFERATPRRNEEPLIPDQGSLYHTFTGGDYNIGVEGVSVNSFLSTLKVHLNQYFEKFKNVSNAVMRGIVQSVRAMLGAVTSMLSACTPYNMAKRATLGVINAGASATTAIFEMFTSVLEYFPANFIDTITFSSSLLDFILCVLDLPMILVSGHTPQHFFSLTFYRRAAIFALEFYKLLKHEFGYVPPQEPIRAQAQSNLSGFETVITMMFAKMALPKVVFETLRDFQSMSSFKLLEDTMWLPNAVNMIIEIPMKLCTYMGLKGPVVEALSLVTLYCPFGKLSRLKQAIYNVYDQAVKSRWNFTSHLCSQIEDLLPRYAEVQKEMTDANRDFPPHFSDANVKMKKIKIKYMYKKESTRVEPICVVFVGPPGTGKSTLLARMVESYNEPLYKHASPGSDKEFYDQYDNEDIFVMDDVGQKGVSQWSDIINMVSTIAYPLNCAAADLKGTKYFTSKLMLMTTNNINLTLTPDCGISDLTALHRRLFLVDFSRCRFEYGAYYGEIELKKYDLRNNVYETVRVLDLNLNTEGGVDLPPDRICENIDAWIYDLLNARKIQYALRNSRKLVLKGIPQNGLKETMRDAAQVWLKLGLSGFLVSFGVEMAYMLGLITSQTANALDSQLFLYGCVLCLISATTYLVSCFMESKPQDSADFAKKMTTKYYRSDRQSKFSVLEAIPESLEEIFKFTDRDPIQNLVGLADAVVGIKVSSINSYTGKQVENTCLGQTYNRHIVIPYHAVCGATDDWCVLTAYKRPNLVHYDKLKCKIIYFDLRDDVAVLRLPEGQPSYFPSRKLVGDPKNKDVYLLTPSTQIKLDDATLTRLDCAVEYKRFGFPEGLGLIPEGESVSYEYGADGLCGAPIFSGDGFLWGHHVAYVSDSRFSGANKGVCKIFRREVRDAIYNLAKAPDEFFVKLKQESRLEGSLAPIDQKFYCPPMSKSKFTPSAINGIFPKDRVPANLKVGEEYLKQTMQESVKIAATPDLEAAAFAKKCMSRLVVGAKFRVLTDVEIINGTELLGSMDKKTSCGHGFSPDKEDYIDFVNLKPKPEFAALIKDTERRILEGEYVLNDKDGKPCMFFQEQLKDELRNVGKENKPRIFKMSTVLHTWLIRKYFGALLEFLHERRNATGVAVGTNPFSEEWGELYRRLCRFPKTAFDGDYRFFDKNMVRLIQDLWNECIMENYAVEPLNKIFTFLLNTVCSTPTITANEVYFTTHSMPSGVGVTAEFNSGINEGYISYCYFVLARRHRKKPSPDDYFNEVVSVKYGDDLVAAVDPEISEWFNGQTFQSVIKQVGLDFTPADKTEWNDTNKLKPVSECTFLKRGFSMHTKLGRIVAPLDKTTMQATLNFVKDERLNDELTRIKLLNFQREAFFASRL